MKKIRRYFRIWLILTKSSFQHFFISRISTSLFLFGKIARIVLFLVFILILLSRSNILKSFGQWQIVIFYLTFNLIDAITQMLFREVYRFREKILTGSFDLVLVKPVDPLFRVLLGGTDLLDFITLLPFIIMIIIAGTQISQISMTGVLLYIVLIINALIISASFHIMVLALGILTTEVENTVMIYREFTGMGKIPIDVYTDPLRSIITYIIPVGIMMTIPVKSLLGLASPAIVSVSFALCIALIFISHTLWRYALSRYTSASG